MAKGHKTFHIPGSRRHFPPDREFRTEHIKLEINLDLENRSIQGTCSIRLTPFRPGTRTLHLDAVAMHLGRVALDGKEVRFDYDGSVITVRPSQPLSPSESHTCTIEYAASPKQGLFFVYPDEDYPSKPVEAWTQSEAEFARCWYPCHDHPNDKSTSEIVLTVPAGYQTISNGRLVSRREEEAGAAAHAGGRVTFHWLESVPHSTYLNSFVVGKFAEIKVEGTPVPVEYYFPEAKKEDAMRYFGLTPDMITTFEDLTGTKFPFEKYSQVTVHDFIYGGMENISATTLTDTRFPDARSEEDFSARYSRPDRTPLELVAHELAHMWFGDLLTTKHWSHAWLNEGFATYFEALYQEHKFGVDEFRYGMFQKAISYFEEDDERYRRAIVDDVYVYSDDLFDAFTYDKAAWMIHELRYVLGDELFLKGIREYVKRFAAKNVDTHDLMEVLEEVSGFTLESYFEQFFFKAGHPELEIEYSWVEEGSIARVLVRQVQQTDELTPIFSFPCDVVFYTALGREVKRINLRAQEEAFSFQLDSEPRVVEFDPEDWILKKVRFKKSYSLYVNQLEDSVDASSRRAAAEELASFKNDESVEVLRRAVEREQHWSVRSEAARSIGKIGSRKALETLLSLVTTLKQRRVRRAAVAALAEFRNDEMVQGILRTILFSDESPYVQCEAALSLAKGNAKDLVGILSQSMNLPGPEHALTEASLEALGYSRTKEASDILAEQLRVGRHTRARIGALKGYIRRGALDEEEVRTLKEILTKDKDFFVRAQTLETVSELEDRRFMEALRKVAEEDTDTRNRRRAMEIYEDLSTVAVGSAMTRAIRDDLERLRSDLRDHAGGAHLG